MTVSPTKKSPLLDELFQTVREAATPSVWSRGVELARGEQITATRDTFTAAEGDGGEIELLVVNPSGGVSPAVTLYPEDAAWSCSACDGDDPCAHVAAAVIAVRRAKEQGLAVPKARRNVAALAYRFFRSTDGSNKLLFKRMLLGEGGEEPLPASVAALATGRVRGPALAATAEDHEIEAALGSERGTALPAKIFPGLIKALARLQNPPLLDGNPIVMRAEPVGAVVIVEDDGPGIRVRAIPDPAIRETFANGAALCGNELRPVARPELTPKEQEILRNGRLFGRQEWGFLVAEILPGLEAKLKLDVRTKQLPRRMAGKPRLELALEKTANGLAMTIEPAIVYGDPVTARVKGGLLYTYGNFAPTRDLDCERRLQDELSRHFSLALDERLTLTSAEALAFVARLEKTERTSRDQIDVTGNGAAHFHLHPPLAPRFESNGTTFVFELTSADGAQSVRADSAQALAAWQRGESVVPLLDGGFAALPQGWLARYGARILELLAARAEVGESKENATAVPQAALPALAELLEDLGAPLPENLRALKTALADFTKMPAAIIPLGLNAQLRPYQEDGVAWLQFLRAQGFGALLADDMGLGKTLQTIAAAQGRTLVVAPTSVAGNWMAELARFRPDLAVKLYHGGGRALDQDADVTVTTYAILRLDLALLKAEPWQTIILDEAQAIKNSSSQVARAAFELAAGQPKAFRIALTGTPVENRLSDLFSQMRFLNPGLLGSERAFQEIYVRPVEAGDQAAVAQLRRRIRPFLLRRMKKDVAKELPPRTDCVVKFELSSAERDRYEAIKLAARREALTALQQTGNVLAALEALLRLRQAATHPDLLPGVRGEASAKFFAFMEKLEESLANGHKALVFSQWTSVLDLLEPMLATAGIEFLRLDGSTRERGEVVAAFQTVNGPRVLIMSLKAGGVGLNLTAADHVFLMDPWWNPAAEDQAADRAHRIGQNLPVIVHRMIAAATVEEKILALQERKRQFASAALDGGDAGAGLTKEDLLALFE